jgi:hypothetical protein
MQIIDFIKDPNWDNAQNMKRLFAWVTSPEIEQSGEGRRQLGYYDGYNGDPPSSQNEDYMRGFKQGQAMISASQLHNAG